MGAGQGTHRPTRPTKRKLALFHNRWGFAKVRCTLGQAGDQKTKINSGTDQSAGRQHGRPMGSGRPRPAEAEAMKL